MKSPCLIALAIIFGLPGCSRDTGPEQVTASEVSASTSPSPGSESPAEVIALAQAPLLEGLGDFNHPIPAANPWAQRYFSQGMMMAAGFNHAEAAYRADLAQYPRNGWSLFGLALSLDAQGEKEEGAAVRQRYENIWARADVSLESSVL